MGILQKKVVLHPKKPWRTGEDVAKNTGTALPALRLGVFSNLSFRKKRRFRGAHGRKPQEIEGGFQGSRIKSAIQLSQEIKAKRNNTTLWFKMITGRKKYFRIFFGGSTGKSCKSPRGYYRGALTGQGLIQENLFGEFFSGALQENPVIAPGQLHEKMFTELFW